MRLAHPHLLWLLLLVPAAVLAYSIAFVYRRRLLALADAYVTHFCAAFGDEAAARTAAFVRAACPTEMVAASQR